MGLGRVGDRGGGLKNIRLDGAQLRSVVIMLQVASVTTNQGCIRSRVACCFLDQSAYDPFDLLKHSGQLPP
jgi:hypothetical protein